ncbi:MAG: hypothetical protein ACRDHL_15535, partial [Candidatus Promineifilaceae bacterium]
MDDRAATASPLLLEANRRLHALRAQVQAKRPGSGPAAEPLCWVKEDLPWTPRPGSLSDLAAAAEKVNALPAHLGWGSQALTASLRRRQQPDQRAGNEADWMALARLPAAAAARPTAQRKNDDKALHRREEWVKLYPDIGLGMLRRELAAPGRLWLLLRHLDGEGRGTLRIDIVTQQLTRKTSTLHVCGIRQLRNLLHDGEGVFWARDEEHIWLRSAARVADALEVERLTGRPVALPVKALLSGIGAFRAHLYAAFHSGRAKDTPHGSQATPISRNTL